MTNREMIINLLKERNDDVQIFLNCPLGSNVCPESKEGEPMLCEDCMNRWLDEEAEG
jgi:hypothetical protein